MLVQEGLHIYMFWYPFTSTFVLKAQLFHRTVIRIELLIIFKTSFIVWNGSVELLFWKLFHRMEQISLVQYIVASIQLYHQSIWTLLFLKEAVMLLWPYHHIILYAFILDQALPHHRYSIQSIYDYFKTSFIVLINQIILIIIFIDCINFHQTNKSLLNHHLHQLLSNNRIIIISQRITLDQSIKPIYSLASLFQNADYYWNDLFYCLMYYY